MPVTIKVNGASNSLVKQRHLDGRHSGCLQHTLACRADSDPLPQNLAVSDARQGQDYRQSRRCAFVNTEGEGNAGHHYC